jgi:hypothetical protein
VEKTNPNWIFHIEFVVTFITILGAVLTSFVFLSAQIQGQSARTDKLYEMFIDLLKEERK